MNYGDIERWAILSKIWGTTFYCSFNQQDDDYKAALFNNKLR
jgi:hypothetical protein